MSSFSGFSESDIRKLQNGESISVGISASKATLTPHKHQHVIGNKSNKPTIPEIRKKILLERKIQGEIQNNDLPSEAKLIHDTEHKMEVQTEPRVEEPLIKDEQMQPLEKKPIDLIEFQTKQKLMEEQNRIRKEQVARALEDRTKRTQKEQRKLEEIQDEFKKLDATLSSDVKILRKQIESASYEYMEAQKRYHKIEKEFLDAKLFLHQKLDKKEMLTEHLCAIIEKNEERKAEKLNDLLLKLEVLDSTQAEVVEVADAFQVQDKQITSNVTT